MRVSLLLLCLGSVGVSMATERPEAYRRKVSLEYNPGWNSSEANLLHIRAVGQNDTLHFVWSTIGAPTMVLVYTGSETSSLHVNWTKLLSNSPFGAIRVEPEESVLYSTAVVFAKVYEYNGTNTSDLSKALAGDFYPAYDLANFTWDSLDGKWNQSDLTATFRGVCADHGGTGWNGSIAFQVTAFEGSDRDAPLPRLLHSANSSKVAFVMHGVAPRGKQSRFALEIFALEEGSGRKELQSVRSIDDEYTPTIFEMAQLVSRPRNDSVGSSFVQWKTAAYASPDAQRTDTIHCQYYPLRTANLSLPGRSLAYAFFGPEAHYAVAGLNVSFGGEDSEAYQEKRYLSWSALIGYGEPPEDMFSTLVMVILAVALGTPVLLLVAGGITVCVAAQKRRYSEYDPIN
uniref:Glycosylated lysosomal membrane protein n=1 Tax=Anolis carolinensis TaxID=28377 RepID=H9GJI9_ANOCA|nr:PREDICTED: glycosylated lysosomal membrane protein [Anolis carolinensis]|eukprot:XP_003229983.1 PREDICTED: glycosylated lysosomal membrane protein [Anolis carolinensis]